MATRASGAEPSTWRHGEEASNKQGVYLANAKATKEEFANFEALVQYPNPGSELEYLTLLDSAEMVANDEQERHSNLLLQTRELPSFVFYYHETD